MLDTLKYQQITPNFHLITNPIHDRYKTELNFQYSSGGAFFEKTKQRGVSHLLEHCILGRTKDKDFYQLKDYLFSKNIYNNAATGILSMYLTLSGHRSDTEEMLDLILEFGFNPTLSLDVLNREREIILREISERRGEPSYRLFFEMAKQVFSADSKYLFEVLGESENVKNADLEMLYELHRGMLERSHIVLSLSGGGVDTDFIRERFESFTKSVPYTPKTKELTYDPGNQLQQFRFRPVVSTLAHEHCDLAIYIPIEVTLANRPIRYFLQSLLLRIPDGVLYDRLRNELGLIYGLHSSFDRSLNTLVIELSCEIKFVKTIVQEVEALFQDFHKVINPDKVQTLKKTTIKKQEMSQDDPQTITDFLVDNLTEYGQPLSYTEYVKSLEEVSLEAMENTFNSIKTNLDRMQIVAVSNKSEIEKIEL